MNHLCRFDVYEKHAPPGRRPRLRECGKPALWCRETSSGYRHSYACDDHRERIARDAAWYEETVVSVNQLDL